MSVIIYKNFNFQSKLINQFNLFKSLSQKMIALKSLFYELKMI